VARRPVCQCRFSVVWIKAGEFVIPTPELGTFPRSFRTGQFVILDDCLYSHKTSETNPWYRVAKKIHSNLVPLGPHMGVDTFLWNCVGSRSYDLKKNLDKTTETELICQPPLPWYHVARTTITARACQKYIMSRRVPHNLRVCSCAEMHNCPAHVLYFCPSSLPGTCFILLPPTPPPLCMALFPSPFRSG